MRNKNLVETLVITGDDVATIVASVGHDRLMDGVISGLDAAFRAFDLNEKIPIRDGFVIGRRRQGTLEWMPIMSRTEALVKMVSYSPENPLDRGLPTILATISLFDNQSGHLLAIGDGVLSTALRTGAASAIASRALAKPDSKTMGLVGAGAQAVTQLHALSRLFPLSRALVYDVDPNVAQSFLRRTAFLGLDVRVSSLEQLEEESDIISTQTSIAIGAGPVLKGDRLRPWVHINAVGSDLEGKTELPRAVLQRSLVCPDYLPQAVREGECQQLDADQIGPSLAELIQQPEKVAGWREKSTVFDSTGFALEDRVAMNVMLHHARALGCGTSLPIEYLAADPLDPYSRPRKPARAVPPTNPRTLPEEPRRESGFTSDQVAG